MCLGSQGKWKIQKIKVRKFSSKWSISSGEAAYQSRARSLVGLLPYGFSTSPIGMAFSLFLKWLVIQPLFGYQSLFCFETGTSCVGEADTLRGDCVVCAGE